MERLKFAIYGRAIEVRYSNELYNSAGNAAHAATNIRQRLILLDSDLLSDPQERTRILGHELLHFVWVRLGNRRRREWVELLLLEREARTRGEAGWSAEWRKQRLTKDDVQTNSKGWREYCCEAFCDTGSVLWTGVTREVSIGSRAMNRRTAWFKQFKQLKL